MLRLVGVTIPEDVDLFNGLRMIKGLDTKNSRSRIEKVLTKAGLYTYQLQPSGKFEKAYPKVGDLTWKDKSRLIDILEMPRAVLRNLRMSPKKLRLVADAVRGKKVDEALAILQFMPKAGAPVLLKLLKSAIANASNNHELRADDLFVAKITVDSGATMKRFRARARGRACRILKRTSHASIVLREKFAMSSFEVPQKAEGKSKAKATGKAKDTAKTMAKKTSPSTKASTNTNETGTTQGGKE